jgi:hypothetical protein
VKNLQEKNKNTQVQLQQHKAALQRANSKPAESPPLLTHANSTTSMQSSTTQRKVVNVVKHEPVDPKQVAQEKS